MEAYQQVHSQDIEELYKGKHGQSEKEYADSRSQGGKMVSGDSKMSGAEYTHGRRVKAANPGMQPDVGGKTKPKSQGKMDKGTRADLEYRKANLKKEETSVDEAVYGGTPEKKKDTRMVVTAADKKGNTPAYQRYKAGDKRYKAADHMKEEEQVDEKFSMAADPSKPESPRPTRKAENKKGMSLRSRAVKAVGTQTRQDKETGIREEKREELEATGIFSAEEIERILEIMND